MDLKHIDIRAEPLHTLLHCVKDVLPAQTDLVDEFSIIDRHLGDGKGDIILIDAKIALGENDDLAARNVVLLEGLANDALRLAVRVNVGLDDQC